MQAEDLDSGSDVEDSVTTVRPSANVTKPGMKNVNASVAKTSATTVRRLSSSSEGEKEAEIGNDELGGEMAEGEPVQTPSTVVPPSGVRHDRKPTILTDSLNL